MFYIAESSELWIYIRGFEFYSHIFEAKLHYKSDARTSETAVLGCDM